MTKAKKFTNNFRTYWQCLILRKEILWASPEYTPNLLVFQMTGCQISQILGNYDVSFFRVGGGGGGGRVEEEWGRKLGCL